MKRFKEWILYSVVFIRRFLCFIGWHKWDFSSTILEVSKRDINPFSVPLKAGEVTEYDYECECCGYKRRRIVTCSLFSYSERWSKENINNNKICIIKKKVLILIPFVFKILNLNDLKSSETFMKTIN